MIYSVLKSFLFKRFSFMHFSQKFMLKALTVVGILVALANTAEARYAKLEDAPVSYDFVNYDIVVEANGCYSKTTEKQLTIRNESGRSVSPMMLTYHGDVESIDVLEAKTIISGREYVLDPKDIETKPLASDYMGLSQQYQIMLNFPQVMVGAKIYFKFVRRVKKPVLPGYFFHRFEASGRLIEKLRLNLTSAIPFDLLVNDPTQALTYEQTSTDKTFHAHIELTKPVYTRLVNEPESTLPEEQQTFWDISSIKAIDPILQYHAKFFEEKISQPLPALLAGLLQKAQLAEDELAQINCVTSELAEHIRYSMDTRTLEGHFIPRDLEDIAQRGHGDCKDYTVCTAAILRQLGMHAEPALVFRGGGYIEPKNYLPGHHLFNHVMLKVTTPSGRVLWVDPTNLTSLAGKIFPDIAGRTAYLLDAHSPRTECIPDHTAADSEITLESQQVDKGQKLAYQGVIQFKGWMGHSFTSMVLLAPPSAVQQRLSEMISGVPSPLNTRLEIPKDLTRIVRDVKIPFYCEVRNNKISTNLGRGVKLTGAWASQFFDIPDDVEGIVYLGDPLIVHKRLTLTHVKAHTLERLNYALTTPWVKTTRTCRTDGDHIVIEEDVEILKKFITPEEAKSEAFLKFKDQLRENFGNTIMILDEA